MFSFLDSWGREPQIGSMLGIDPGTSLFGLARLDYDLRTNAIVRTTTRTIVARRLPLCRRTLFYHGHKAARLNALRVVMLDELELTQAVEVFCEDNYYNQGTPTAYKPLVETVAMVRSAVQEFDSMMSLTITSPSAIKASIGVSGQGNKSAVLAAMLAMTGEIAFEGDLLACDNNAVDALAIVVTGYKQVMGLLK